MLSHLPPDSVQAAVGRRSGTIGWPQVPGLRRRPLGGCGLAVIFFFLVLAMECRAAAYLYEFKGTILSSDSFNPEYSESYLDGLLVVPQVTYLFEIDFDRDAFTQATSAGDYEYFYSRLIGDGVMETVLGSEASPVTLGFNADFYSITNVAEIQGDGVRILCPMGALIPFSRWRVHDWQVGDELRLQDFSMPLSGTGGTYYHGKVTLTSITPIPEPAFLSIGMGLLALRVAGRRR